MYCSCSNYFGPNEFGHLFVLEFVLGTFGDALEACLIYKEGVVTMCLLEPSLDDHELLSSTSPNAISVTSIYLMHTFLAFNLV